MSYWGVVVIVELIGSIPVFGFSLSHLLWCSSYYILNRIYTLHFAIGLSLFAIVVIHLVFLHSAGSSTLNLSKSIPVAFYVYLGKDFFALFLGLLLVGVSFLINPVWFGECDNYSVIDIYSTPVHITPVFSILFVYLFVKVINNKLLSLIIVVFVLLSLSFTNSVLYFSTNNF